MNDVWLTSLMVKPPVILRRQLKPFSLFHSLILERMENPFWIGGERLPEHFFEAIDICSRTWEENRAWYSAPKRKQFRRKQFRRWYTRCLLHERIDAAISDFDTYLSGHAETWPRENSGDGTPLFSAWQFRVVTFLTGIGFSESDAWNMNLSRARCYYDASEERAGNVKLISQHIAQIYRLVGQGQKLHAKGKTEEAKSFFDAAQKIQDEHDLKESLP